MNSCAVINIIISKEISSRAYALLLDMFPRVAATFMVKQTIALTYLSWLTYFVDSQHNSAAQHC